MTVLAHRLNDFDTLGYYQPQLSSLDMSSSSPHSIACNSITFHPSFDPPNNSCASAAPKCKDAEPDTFTPKSPVCELSPTSSTNSDFDFRTSLRSSVNAFVATRSRVILLYNLPFLAEAYLSAVFLPQSPVQHNMPTPKSLWNVHERYSGYMPNSVWVVFETHEEAATALSSLSSSALSVTTALESDLEPFHKLRRFALATPTSSLSPRTTPPQHQLRVSSSYPNLSTSRNLHTRTSGMGNGDYTISSNPPNPRTSFRLGDWICNSPNCAAHNFGRNLTCIGCGCPRSNGGSTPVATVSPHQQAYTSRNNSSPRFSSFPSHSMSLPNPSVQSSLSSQPAYTYIQPQQPQPSHSQPGIVTPPAPSSKPVHPLLTPSGRAFAVGGRVQNVSSDPLSPCVMYWPDNEPFPEQGQIRPSTLVGVPQPPILNTGNKGPIAHQPGDWVCLKCNYLNWRRRKVCQTCLPYAEGNGDSISAAVQAERIALLTSVLSQNQSQSTSIQAPPRAPRSHSMTPPLQRRPFVDTSPTQTQSHNHAPVHRSHSHFELSAQYNNRIRDDTPIYQTPGNRPRQPSPLYTTEPDFNSLPVHAPAPLLPSFLQDIVQSPALSPTSTSSADLSYEEYEETLVTHPSFPRTPNSEDRAPDLPLGNIWRLDGEETKSLSAFALPNNRGLLGSDRKSSNDSLRLHKLITS